MRIIASKRGPTTTLRFRYDDDLLDLVRDIPGRIWDPTAKQWTIPTEYLQIFIKGAEGLSHSVNVIGEGQSYQGPQTAAFDSWAQTLFGAVGRDRAPSVYRALSKVLHPDMQGGSEELMKDLSNAYEEWRKRK